MWVASYCRKWTTLSTLLSLLSTPCKPRSASKPCGSMGRLPETEAAEGHVRVYVHACVLKWREQDRCFITISALHSWVVIKYSWLQETAQLSVTLLLWHSAQAAAAFRVVQQGVNISTYINTNVAVQLPTRQCRDARGYRACNCHIHLSLFSNFRRLNWMSKLQVTNRCVACLQMFRPEMP